MTVETVAVLASEATGSFGIVVIVEIEEETEKFVDSIVEIREIAEHVE